MHGSHCGTSGTEPVWVRSTQKDHCDIDAANCKTTMALAAADLGLAPDLVCALIPIYARYTGSAGEYGSLRILPMAIRIGSASKEKKNLKDWLP